MKRLRNRNGVDFDMTPLLDVIFIVLMVVMCHQTLNTQKDQGKIDELKTDLDQATAKIGIYETQLGAYENANDLVAYVTLYADYDTGNPKIRHIKLAYNNDVAFDELTITPTTEIEIYSKFQEEMEKFLSEKDNTPVLIILEDSHILYRDQQELSKILQGVDDKYDNVFQTVK